MLHKFQGKWISNEELANLKPRNVFHRQLENLHFDCDEFRNQHILFRRKFNVSSQNSDSKIYISADDYYKLYINGKFVAQGPAPAYHFQYNYNEIDIQEYLVNGENLIAIHTYYQGLINRVWQSGDNRHGLICDVMLDGKVILASDETFKVCEHSGYTECGVCGYETQILEQYDSGAKEVGFESFYFDDSYWSNASICVNADYSLCKQNSYMLEFEKIFPKKTILSDNKIFIDFGANYVGYLSVRAKGVKNDVIIVRCAQELNEDNTIRFNLRANCVYEEKWILSGKEDLLNWFDYKSFRFAELEIPKGVCIYDIQLVVRHYPFELKEQLNTKYLNNKILKEIWDLCVRTQKYGVQEVIQDCMEREKGFYLGDGCYTALANMILTQDDSMVRKLINDAFSSSFITKTLVTCLNCSLMQEIAEYPLILVSLIYWHYKYTNDKNYLQINYQKATSLMNAYRDNYEKDGLLRNLDKWCVVEWPPNFQHDYDANLVQGTICEEAHISINSYYIYAINIMNEISKILSVEQFRDTKNILKAYYNVFYDHSLGLFVDSENSKHISLVGNAFAYGFNLCPNDKSKQCILDMLDEYNISSLSFFCTFPVLMRFAKDGDHNRLLKALSCENAWARMLREGASTTFEGWGKDTKWNTSLFHLTMSYASIFLADIDLDNLFF